MRERRSMRNTARRGLKERQSDSGGILKLMFFSLLILAFVGCVVAYVCNQKDSKGTGEEKSSLPEVEGSYYRGLVERPERKLLSQTPKRVSKVEKAIDAGLKWLADNQQPDGHWVAEKSDDIELSDVGVTGLALLALTGAGHTERSGKHRRNVQKAIKWLSEQQDEIGNFATQENLYNHAIPTLALLEEISMAPIPRTKEIAANALKYLQTPETRMELGDTQLRGRVTLL